MPKFTVQFIRRIELSGSVEVTAKDDDAAETKAGKLIDDDKLGELADTTVMITGVVADMDGWELVNDEITIDSIDGA